MQGWVGLFGGISGLFCYIKRVTRKLGGLTTGEPRGGGSGDLRTLGFGVFFGCRAGGGKPTDYWCSARSPFDNMVSDAVLR